MVKLYCTANVEDLKQRDNLVKCINTLGLIPEFVASTVFVNYEGDEETAEKLLGVFQQYPFHGISIIK